MLEGIRNGGWQPSLPASAQSPSSAAPTVSTQTASVPQNQLAGPAPVEKRGPEDANDSTYAGSVAASVSAADHITSFLDEMRDIQDRFAAILPAEKEQTRKRAMSLMQSLFASQMVDASETAPASSGYSPLFDAGGKDETDSLAVQWYRQT